MNPPNTPVTSPSPAGDPASDYRAGAAAIAWPAPKGPVLTDLAWIKDVARKYQLDGLDIPAGAVVLERISATGGRCFCYPDGSWLIGLSRPRLQCAGRPGVEGILAHELLHAWLWSQQRYRGHGAVFEQQASARGIPRWCAEFREVRRRQAARQPILFDAPGPLNHPAADKIAR